ncbi:hypothetical protein EJ05DRAFT_496798 [Pseudovirgaria hyperparasitica]|uniref:Uncharacterized protein n=1 Tax=Pseudovirgaria hyperparasitica TaxID=470096 RepID=A0A6A6WIL9_9PEZI|nr:uncharacterized protein EJ05DRAFT_496798 [Pseudovirgaria hyperparasitica]KAF2761910.1 hypothetical protein EJ05DRAFT_496798 [Pseudovirgaria hyperparasitica]
MNPTARPFVPVEKWHYNHYPVTPSPDEEDEWEENPEDFCWRRLTPRTAEHVLRPSASAGVIGSQLMGNRMRPSAGTANGNNKKPSPSPSFKRKTVERMIKEHGSPPGMRVTAGGRVVPIDLPPLSSPRFPFNNAKSQATSRATSAPQLFANHNNSINGSVFPFAGHSPLYVVNNHICQLVNGQLVPLALPVYENNGVLPSPQFPTMTAMAMGDQYMPQLTNGFLAPVPPVNLSPLAQAIPMHSGIPPMPSAVPSQQVASDPGINLATKIKILEDEYSKLESQLKELERLEVVQSDPRGPQWRQEVVKTKRTFITVLDIIRKLLKALRAGSSDGGNAIDANPQPLPSSLSTGHSQPPNAHLQLSTLSGLGNTALGPSPVSQPTQMDMSAYYQSFGYHPQLELQAPVTNQASVPTTLGAPLSTANGSGTFAVANPPSQSTSSNGILTHNSGQPPSPWRSNGPRRSHAVEIKDPRDGSKKSTGQQSKSALNPTSPTYEPNSRVKTPEPRSPGIFVPPSPSPIPSPSRHEAIEAQHPWLFDQSDHHGNVEGHKSASGKTVKHKSSAASVQTADFFPVNTHEHSNKTPSGAASKSGSPLKLGNIEGAPATPEKKFLMDFAESQFRSPNDENSHPAAPPVSPADARGSSHNGDLSKSYDRYSMSSADTLKQTLTTTEHAHTFVTSSLDAKTFGSIRSGQDLSTLPVHKPQPTKLNSDSWLRGYGAGMNRSCLPDGADEDFVAGYCRGLQDWQKSQRSQPGNPGKFTEVFHTSSTTLSSRSPANVVALELTANGIAVPTRRPHAPDHPHCPPGLGARPSVDVGFVTRPGSNIWSPTKTDGFPKDFQARRQVPAPIGTSATQGAEHIIFDQRAASSSPMMSLSRSVQPSYTIDSQSSRAFPASFPSQVAPPVSSQRYYPPMRAPGQHVPHHSPRKGDPSRISQCDGALDDMVDVVTDSGPSSPPASKTTGTRSNGNSPKKGESPAKAKLEQIANSVAKQVRGNRSKKTAEDEQKPGDDPAHMSTQDKRRWRENWRKRFGDLKNREKEEIDRYQQENATD